MRLITILPFPCVFFKHWYLDDREVGVLLVKGTFGIKDDGSLGTIADQAPLIEADVFWGDDNASSLKHEQDYAPSKTCTDVVVNAIARSPEAEPLPDWAVSVEIKDRAYYEFRVRGPSEWRKSKDKWRLSDPEPITELPIQYEYAYGGTCSTEDGEETYEFNPIGRGFSADQQLKMDDPIAAPQIGDLGEFMAADIQSPMTVHGLGPITKSWLPRRSEAGTFDDAWKNTRHPRMPKDYAFSFWNAAPKRLQIEPFLPGAEEIILKGLRHDPAPYHIHLPSMGVAIHKDAEDGPKARLTLTDVQIDVTSADPVEHRVYLIWRAMLSDPDEINQLHIKAIAIEEKTHE